MECPKCKEAMIILELRQVEIDYCTSCSGIWLDHGELDLLVEENEGQKDTVLASFTEAKNVNEKTLKCPICSKRMDKILCGNAQQVLIDGCPDKHGLWFDEGELLTLIKSHSENDEGPVLNLLHEMFRFKINQK